MMPLALDWPSLSGGRLFLCRHGQTGFNASLRFQGHHDTPLSDLGFRQAEQLSARLAEETIDVAYSSDLIRARDTARLALAARSVPLHMDARLREMSFGRWEGLTFAEIQNLYPEDVEKRKVDPVNFVMPGGESLAQLADRIHLFLAEILPRHPQQSLLLMAHGGTINATLSVVLGIPLAAWWQLRNHNANLSIVRFSSYGPRLVTFNDVCHLTEC